MNPCRPSPSGRVAPTSARARSVITRGSLLMGLLVGPLLGGCKGEDSESKPAPAEQAAEQNAGQKEAFAAEPAASAARSGPLGNPLPVGPPLEILPGQGIGPIRFGATFATVERHMANPCDERTETKCIYVKQAVEFTMKDGVVAHIQLHRRDRPAGKTAEGKPRYYGSYYGGLHPEIVMGLHKHVAVAELQKPERVESLPKPDPNGTIERHHYPGLIVEYDRIPNGNTVLGGFQILPAPDAKSPALTGAELEAARAAAKGQPGQRTAQ